MKRGNILHQITLALAFLMMTGLLGSTTTYAQTGCEALIGAYGYSVVGLATFDNYDDGYRAVIVALANGEVREIFFNRVVRNKEETA